MKLNNDSKKSRREFLGNCLRTGSLAAMGGLVDIGVSRECSGLVSTSLSDLSGIDPESILYEEIREPITTGLSEARAMTVNKSGTLYVAGDQAIKVFDPGGLIRSTCALTVVPRCMAPSGERLYIGTRDRVVIADRNGKVQDTWPSLGDNAFITCLALGEEHCYISDAGQRIVWCFDRKGRFIRQIGAKDPEKNIPGFVVPSPYFHLALGPDGLLRVANPGRHRIETYTVKGDLESTWGRFSNTLADFTACCNPVNFAILLDGSFATCEKGIDRIKVYDANGKFLGVVAGPEQLTGGAWAGKETQEGRKQARFGVAANDASEIYVLDRARGVVRTFTRKRFKI